MANITTNPERLLTLLALLLVALLCLVASGETDYYASGGGKGYYTKSRTTVPTATTQGQAEIPGAVSD